MTKYMQVLGDINVPIPKSMNNVESNAQAAVMNKYRCNNYKPFNMGFGSETGKVVPLSCVGKMTPPPKFVFKNFKITFTDGGQVCFPVETSDLILAPL